jgi:cell division protein FtsB
MSKRPLSVRLSIAGLVALLLVLQARLWLSDDGWREVSRLRNQVAVQEAENAELEERNMRLKAEVHDLKEGQSAVEERARADLGLIGRDESFFLVVPANGTSDDTD